MRRTRKDGFIMSMVIVALGLLGVIMAVLGRGTNTMLFQADRTYIDAVERNLTASGLAWAGQQIRQGRALSTSGPVVLDLESFPASNAGLQVSFAETEPGTVDVRIETSCVKGRQQRREAHTYSFARKP
jgi:hypothetical protein